MSTQQDIYVVGSENRPPMLNKDNYVPWSTRIIRYPRSRPNGKMIVDSIENGPYIRRMIATPGESNLPVPVPESFHEQTDDELTKTDIKRIDADDQAIQTILLGLPEDVYAAVDSCETAKEIWECVRQMMKGSDIGEQEKKEKLFNKWEKFTSTDWESIESYYHRFMQLMNDLKRNKHFLENIALNLKQIQNVGENGGNQFGQYAGQVSHNQQGYNAWHNVGIQGAQNVVQNAGVRGDGNQNRIVVVPGIANQNGTGNVVAARAEGDLDEKKEVNANCILRANLKQASTSGTQHDKASVYDTDGSVEYTDLLEPIPRPQLVPQNDNHVISVALSMVQSEGTVEISFAPNEETRAHQETVYCNLVDQVAQEADESLDKQKSLEYEIERLLKASVSHDIMSIAQNGFADVPSDLRTELDRTKEKLELCIIKKEKEYVVLWNNWYTKCEECKYDKISYDKAYNDMQQKKLESKIIELEFQVVNYERKISHLKTTYKNMFDSIKSNQAHAKLHDLIYENAQLRARVFENTSESMKNTSWTSVTPHVDKPKLSAVTHLSKKLHASMPSHSVPQPREFNENVSFNTVTASSIGLAHTAKTRRPQPKGNTRNVRVPSASKSSEVKNNVTVEEHRRTLLLSKNQKTMSSECCPNLSVVRPLGLFQAYDREHQASHQLCVEVFGNCLGHNLFSVGQFCDADLEVAFRRNTCFVRDLDGVDLLKGNRSMNLYINNLYDIASASPICLMARATPTKSWLWHQRLSHLNFDTINELAKNDLVFGLPKLKYAKEHLCPSCEQGKSKKASHPPKPVSNSKQRLHLLHMDLCEQRMKHQNVGITHETPAVKTPQQNGVVERRNRTLVEAARTMLILSHAPLFLWAEAIATACYTQNHSIIHRRFNKTPYELIQGRKLDIFYLHVFGALCYPKNDREDIGDIGFFIGYAANFVAYRVYNRRTKKTIETMNVTFDELSAMAFEQNSSRPGLQSMTSEQISSELELTYAPSTITPQRPSERDLDILFEPLHNEYLGGRPSEAPRAIPAAPIVQNLQAPTTSMSFQDSAPVPTNSSNTPVSSYNVDATSQQHAQQQINLTPSPTASAADNVSNAVFEGDLFVNPCGTPSTESVVSSTQYVDPSNMHTFYQPLDVWELVPSPDGIKPLTLQWLFKNKHDEENMVIRNKNRLVVYVDDIIFGSTYPRYATLFFDLMKSRFEMSMMGEMMFFLGLQVNQSSSEKFDLDQIGIPVDATKYRSMIGAFMYLTSSRPDIVHATCVCARYQAYPTEKHLKEVKRIFRYLRRTVNMGLCQNRRDLRKDTPIERLEVLRYDIGKRSKVRMGIMPTEKELTLEQTQQVAENHHEEEDQEGNNSSEIETFPLFPIHGGSQRDFFCVKASNLSSGHSVGAVDSSANKEPRAENEPRARTSQVDSRSTGLKKFVDDCKPLVDSVGNIRCLCKSCRLVLWVSIKHLSDHISKYGFDPSYKTWNHHDELDLSPPPPVIDNTRQSQMSDMTALQRLYKSSHTAKEMTWHVTGKCTEPDKMQHPVDGRAWKDFDTKHLDFAAEPRNVRLGLAADGFNPFGNLKSSFMLTLLIPDLKSPGKDIDVYLRLLIHDLKDLSAKPGVETIDIATSLKFNMRVMVLWTINDFPAQTSMSGWSGSLEFNGETEDGDPPREFSRDAIMTQLARLPTRVKGKHLRFGDVKIKRNVLQYLPPDVAKPLIELCLFFKEICSETLMVDDMLKAQSKIHQHHVDNDPGVSESSELFALACGPSQTPVSVNSCVVNGVRFIMHSRDERRTAQNSGICSPDPDREIRPLGWKVVEHVSHKKFLNVGFIVVEDDPNVIHFDNSSDLALSTSLNDLGIAALHIDGQSIDVNAPPDIIDVVDKDDDIIYEEDLIPHDLADYGDEDLVNLDIDDGVNMSANVARGHGSDGSGDDRKGTRKPNLGGRRAGMMHTREETRNLRELPLHYPFWSQMPPERKARVVEKNRMESSAIREYPSLIHIFFLTHNIGGVFLNPGDKALYGTVIPPSPPCTHSSVVAKRKKSEKLLTKQYDGGSESNKCGDDEPGDDEDDNEDGKDEDDS
nr:integrase, catalytic region, zinc finger, CCHC-type, peptidase aspartic, catalytic [Tanacetum cinerariifolium]